MRKNKYFNPIDTAHRIITLHLRSERMFDSYITAAWVTGIIVMTIGFISALFMRESFGKDLNFVEL